MALKQVAMAQSWVSDTRRITIVALDELGQGYILRLIAEEDEELDPPRWERLPALPDPLAESLADLQRTTD